MGKCPARNTYLSIYESGKLNFSSVGTIVFDRITGLTGFLLAYNPVKPAILSKK